MYAQRIVQVWRPRTVLGNIIPVCESLHNEASGRRPWIRPMVDVFPVQLSVINTAIQEISTAYIWKLYTLLHTLKKVQS